MPRHERSVLAACVLALSALFVPGCGDDGESAGAATPTPTGGRTPPSPTRTFAPTSSPTVTSTATPADGERIRAVPLSETWDLPGLRGEVHVVRTEANVPHIYASNRHDLALVQCFITCRDRFFMIDLTRRLALGRVAALVGELGLGTDIESRLTGMTMVADNIHGALSGEHAEMADAFAAGVNACIEQTRAGALPPPSELNLASLIFGRPAAELMESFGRRDIAAILAVLTYQLSFDPDDPLRDAARRAVENGDYSGVALGEQRRAGALQEVATAVQPILPVTSTLGFGLEQGDQFIPGPPPASPRPAGTGARAKSATAPAAWLERVQAPLERLRQRLGHAQDFGSNAWAVAGDRTPDGFALLAGDGHLMLDVPSVFVQVGLDTAVFGGGDVHQLGLTIPGLPIMAVGTNGRVAWSQTQLHADVTDWYEEQIFLDTNGVPAESAFRGERRALVASDESYTIADVPALGSVGRTETWRRFATFDGRLLVEIEGGPAMRDEPLGSGEALAYTASGIVVPRDEDGDGAIRALSLDFSGFDVRRALDGPDSFGHAGDVFEFREATRKLLGYSQNLIAADAGGNILYSSYQAMPCRAHLERLSDGRFAPGANPQRLIDGTRFGGFTVPTTGGVPDENAGAADPQRCLVPFDSSPQAINPSRGYVFTANNDPDHVGLDGALDNDAWYLGGPYDSGYRGFTIDRELHRAVEERSADVERMAEIQGNHESRLGERFTPFLLEAVDFARNLQFVDRVLSPSEQRTLDLYVSESVAVDEVQQRLRAWGERGYEAASGVETFYHTPQPGETADAVATMVFNAWMSRVVRLTWDDEGLLPRLFPREDQTRALLIDKYLRARDAGSPEGVASHNPETGESAFFDVLETPAVETSREIILAALVGALEFLRSEPLDKGRGGFGTTDMDAWLWGLRHQARFESLLKPFLGDDPRFAVFTEPFAIDTTVLPLAPNLTPDDPRAALQFFPRPGDNWNVDAGHPYFSGTDFSYGDGPVMRMVIALKDGEVRGQNVIPGGQSGLTDSPHFADQAALWLGNRAIPLRFHVGDVVAGAQGRELYRASDQRSK